MTGSGSQPLPEAPGGNASPADAPVDRPSSVPGADFAGDRRQSSPPERVRYVYYRVRLQDEPRLDACFAAFRAQLQSMPADAGAPAQRSVTLARRVEPTANDRSLGAATWLERHVFTGTGQVDPVRTDDWIEAQAASSGLAALALDGRRVEWFVTCA